MEHDVIVENVTKRFSLSKPQGLGQVLRNYYQEGKTMT